MVEETVKRKIAREVRKKLLFPGSPARPSDKGSVMMKTSGWLEAVA
jgi:hypothetical protein